MGWDPWAAADRMHDLDVYTDQELPTETGGGLYIRYGDGSGIILLDPRLVGAQRRDALAHELVHHERGGGACTRRLARFRVDRIREERRVWSITAERLVPPRELAIYCDLRADLGEGVAPEDVMYEYDVTRRVAEAALDNLNRHERGTL